MLYNEIPAPEFDVLRDGNSSEDIVLLDGTGIVDPENDDLIYTWTSSLDGVLLEGTGPIFFELGRLVQPWCPHYFPHRQRRPC
jgi:hypothetical protein